MSHIWSRGHGIELPEPGRLYRREAVAWTLVLILAMLAGGAGNG